MSEILIDLTELARHGLQTGIQRVERQVLRYWPGPAALVPVVFEPRLGGFVRLGERALAALLAAQAPALEAAPLLRPSLAQVVFNPELFHDAARAAHYRRLVVSGTSRVKWLVHDFLPWLHPEFFPRGTGRLVMHYVLALREIPEVAFVSAETRADYQRAIMRSAARGGPVFPLGADGLGLARQAFAPERRTFVVLGQVMVRKNVGAILEAFSSLWRQGLDVRLAVLGGIDREATHERARLAELAHHPNFTLLEHPSDARVREVLGHARALVSASEAEGFGLPPFEALWAGIPVIVPALTPSIRLLPPLGQIRLARADPESLAAAIRTLAEDATARRLWGEAQRLSLPTWRDFASSLAAWLQE